jgi:hypothetical protein
MARNLKKESLELMLQFKQFNTSQAKFMVYKNYKLSMSSNYQHTRAIIKNYKTKFSIKKYRRCRFKMITKIKRLSFLT